MKHFYCSCSRSKHDKHRLRAVSHFFTARSLRQTMISFVWIHKTFSSYNLNKHRDGHKEQNTGQPETRIMKVMYKSIPKPPIPPGQSPGIWLALSSVQWGIWPKMMPARWGIWLSCQNVCQRSETKGFRNSLIQHVHRVHGSLLLSIPRGFFCSCRFYIVEYAFV